MFWWCCADFSSMNGLFGFRDPPPSEEEKNSIKNDSETDAQFESIFTYNTGRDYVNRYGSAFDDLAPAPPLLSSDPSERSVSERAIEFACAAVSSSFLVLTLPFSIFFSLKFVRPFERLVVMRLGRARGVLGPGAVLVLPWIDKATTVDLRVLSLELPPIQIITADKGVLEMEIVVFIKVTDPLTAHCAIQDVQQTLRTLSYTTLCRELSKRMLMDITNVSSLEKTLLHCQEELNGFVQRRGVEVDRLQMVKSIVLKKEENAAVQVFQTIAKSELGQQLLGQFGAHFRAMSTADPAFSRPAPPTPGSSTSTIPIGVLDFERQKKKSDLDADLAAIMERIRGCLSSQLVRRVGKYFRIRCIQQNSAPEFDIDLRSGEGWCGWTFERASPLDQQLPSADVHFILDKHTLVSLVDGSLSAMSAYLDGRVQIQGAVQDAILIKHLAEAAASGMGSKKGNPTFPLGMGEAV